MCLSGSHHSNKLDNQQHHFGVSTELFWGSSWNCFPLWYAVIKDWAVLSHSVMFRLHGLKPARLLCPWGFSRQEYWSGLPCPPPRDLPNQGANPGLPHCRQILYRLSHQGNKHENLGFISHIDAGEGNGNPLQYSCLGELHAQRSLAGYSPLSHKESDKTERLT